MAVVLKLKRSFLTALAECRALYRHSLMPRAPHTDAGVEAAFLQMYKSWESLQEESTIAFMTGRLRADGRTVPCDVSTKTEHFARMLLYQERRYILWTNFDDVKDRWDRIFGKANLLVDAIRPAATELKQMSVLRNTIAHSSVVANKSFYELTKNQLGGNPAIARPAGFLAHGYPRDPARTYFDRYADVLEVAAISLTG